MVQKGKLKSPKLSPFMTGAEVLVIKEVQGIVHAYYFRSHHAILREWLHFVDFLPVLQRKANIAAVCFLKHQAPFKRGQL